MQNYLVVTVLGRHQHELVEQISSAIKDCGCNIVDAKVDSLGEEMTMMMMLSGSWDSIAKMESQFDKLESRLDLNILKKRTEKRKNSSDLMPYAIDIVSFDHVGVVSEIARFVNDNRILIHDMHTNTYLAANTGTPMFSLHMTVNIPTSISITALRGDFIDFCEKLNLDAILEPVK